MNEKITSEKQHYQTKLRRTTTFLLIGNHLLMIIIIIFENQCSKIIQISVNQSNERRVANV